MNKNKVFEILRIVLGSGMVAFAIYNIHARCGIAEGGQLGIELLLYNWFNISPAISSVIMDTMFYILGIIVLKNKFAVNALVGTLSYSLFYFIFQHIPYLLPDFSNNLLLASILGGIIVGIGCGMVVKSEGACGGDDSLALVISKITKLHISISYFVLDVLIILVSLSYISFTDIFYSLLTAIISSITIGFIYNK